MDEKKEERLLAFERVLQAVKDSQEDTILKMEKLKQEGKVNSATYRQLMGKKMNNTNMLNLFLLHDIE